jgi:hypothetical protein
MKLEQKLLPEHAAAKQEKCITATPDHAHCSNTSSCHADATDACSSHPATILQALSDLLKNDML